MLTGMGMLELPHSPGCLVCGRNNPHGLKLFLHVDEQSGHVRCDFIPRPEHVGFEGIIHGGALATVIDEAMVWAATWRGKRFCLCGELTVRFRQMVHVGQTLIVAAQVDYSRPTLIETTARVIDSGNSLIATANGKYMPVAPDQHKSFVATLLEEEATSRALTLLRGSGV
jgi:acyl-coenzyme A thioesterase PaaI-like protein